jgi:hypothetical protein
MEPPTDTEFLGSHLASSGYTADRRTVLHTIQRVERNLDILRDFTDTHHSYIRWADRPSRTLYWSLHEDGRMVGVFGLASGFVRPKVISDLLGEHGIAFNEVANNIVYCLAGQDDANAGSKLLKLCRRDAKRWWKERYGDDLKLIQTFILPPRTGAVYKADNWTYLGVTKGETVTTRTLYGDERFLHPEAELRTFGTGETKFLVREHQRTPQKLIFVRLLTDRGSRAERGRDSMMKWMVEERTNDGTWQPVALRGSTPTAEDHCTILKHLAQRVGDDSPTVALGQWRLRHPQTGQTVPASTFYLANVRRLADRSQDSSASDYSLRSLPATATTINGNTDPNSVGVILADVQTQTVEWLWAQRIPRAKLTLLEGDPEEGKSTVAFDLAARVSRGAAMPLDMTMTKPAGVVILSAEDALGDTIRPRLEAAGADLDRILGFRFEELPTIPEGLAVIEQAIQRVEAALVIVDPLVAFFGRTVNAYRDHDVRRALTPLVALAERTGAAVIAIRHLNKNQSARAKHRGSGSIGIIGAARSALLVARDPEDPNRRLLAPVKQNLCESASAVAFSLVPAGTTARVAWLGETAHTADGLLAHPAPEADRAALADAMEFLRAALVDGERPASDVLSEATTLGIAEMTLRRARKALRVHVRRQGFGKDGRFLLALPSNGTDPADGAKRTNGNANGNGNGNGNGLDHEQPVVPNGFSVS